MMGHGKWKPSFITRIKEIIFPDRIYKYLVFMRKANYYSHFSPLSLGESVREPLLIIQKSYNLKV